MNCDCVSKFEKELAEAPFVVAKAGQNVTAECMAKGMRLTPEMDLITTINIPFRIRGTGKGFTSAKGKEMPFIAKFCPFCGMSADPRAELDSGFKPIPETP